MKKRETSNFKVNLANTDRLKNTSIITMQNMLNEDETRMKINSTNKLITLVFSNYDFISYTDC